MVHSSTWFDAITNWEWSRKWDVEDEIRLCEKAGDFGERFVALARAVYFTNDRRAALKREINRLCNSAIVEEKHYA